MNGNETKEKDYLLEPSVDRWMVSLLKEARLVDHDVGVSSRGDNKETKCQQFPIDEALYQKGRIFYQRNFFVVIVSMLAGLYSIIFLPSIAAVLKITGMMMDIMSLILSGKINEVSYCSVGAVFTSLV